MVRREVLAGDAGGGSGVLEDAPMLPMSECARRGRVVGLLSLLRGAPQRAGRRVAFVGGVWGQVRNGTRDTGSKTRRLCVCHVTVKNSISQMLRGTTELLAPPCGPHALVDRALCQAANECVVLLKHERHLSSLV